MSNEEAIKAVGKNGNDPALDLAVERTELALERTHLAWVRTMFTLMTAGLAIDKGFEIMHKQRLMTGDAWIKNGHFVGIALTAFSTILLLMESIYFIKRCRHLSGMRRKRYILFSTALILSMLVMLLGIMLVSFMILSG